jgi:16S rRNA A1518/A1519 N6-dimethyltransferase RsmA/KsgA/DIM1 with predicted DNA glycosylase/AP lyase activity
MINKNLKKLFNTKLFLLDELNIDLKKRPEELSNEIFYKITIQYEKLLD